MASILDVNNSRGKIIMHIGPMNSGKTEEVIRWAQNIKYHTDCKVLVFKPDIDKRAPSDKIISNTADGKVVFEAITIDSENPAEAIEVVEKNPEFIDVVVFDEVNFFDVKIIDVFEKLKKGEGNKKRVVVGTGLDKNFRGEPFEPVPYVTAKADIIEIHEAYCKHILESNGAFRQCKKPATHTIRLLFDDTGSQHYDFFDKDNKPVFSQYKPASYYDPTVVVEKKEKTKQQPVYYIAVCPDCFIIPGKEEAIAIYDFIKKEKEKCLEEILKEFPSENTERILNFLVEEKRVIASNNVFSLTKYVFDMSLGTYISSQ